MSFLSAFMFKNTTKSTIVNNVRYARYLRKEFLGEYLPKVDNKHLEEHKNNKFSKYSSIDSPNVNIVEKNEGGANDNNNNSNSKSREREDMAQLYPQLYNSLPYFLKDGMRETVERREMMKRHKHIDIPIFYTGSIMAATVSDSFSHTKMNRFVGICIYKSDRGLLSSFRLRNVIDNIGIEIEFELYNPTLLRVEVLKLERRLDENLFYLRDAPHKYSQVPFDFAAVPHDDNVVPLNEEKVEMNSLPWNCDWLHHDYRGIGDSAWQQIDERKRRNAQAARTSADRYDLMMIYRRRGSRADLRESMEHVELLHRDLVDFQQQRHRERLASLKKQQR